MHADGNETCSLVHIEKPNARMRIRVQHMQDVAAHAAMYAARVGQHASQGEPEWARNEEREPNAQGIPPATASSLAVAYTVASPKSRDPPYVTVASSCHTCSSASNSHAS